MKIDILTLFPEMFTGPFDHSMIKRAREAEIVEIQLWNIRDFAQDKHRMTDDYPYGGGAGMVMKPEPIVYGLQHVCAKRADLERETVLMSPQGQVFSQDIARELARKEHLVLICGHYEGVDERVYEYIDREISIGDYVLTGGELPALVVIDAVSRLIPGVLGCAESAEFDSFQDGLLEHPHYTRPAVFRGHTVPEVLLSGHHGEIRRWRLRESLKRTRERRPDLLEAWLAHRQGKDNLTPEQQQILADIKAELSRERR